MLANVQQATIKPLIKATIAPGSLIYTSEYAIYTPVVKWGYEHKTVCHGRGEYARDEDGDGFCEVHVNTPGGILVAIAFVAASSSRHLSRKVTLVLRLIRVCSQCQKAGQSLAESLVGDPSHLAPWNPY